MRNLANILSVLLFFLFTERCTAEITSVNIQSDSRDTIVFEKFGFAKTGHVSIAISSVSFTSNLSRPADPSRMGFFLVLGDALFESCNVERFFNISYLVTNPGLISLFTFQDLSPPSQSSFNKSYAVTHPNIYSLIFANCNNLSQVTMDVRTEVYNTYNGPNNRTTKVYLSSGLTKLPSLYYVFSIVYLCFLVVWIRVCFRNLPFLHWIHLLMGVLLVMKGLNLLCAALIQHYLKVTGLHRHGWELLFYISQLYDVLLFYIVIAVVTKTKKALVAVIPLQALATLVLLTAETSPDLYTESIFWNFLLAVLNLPCIYAIWYLTWNTGESDDQAANNYSVLREFNKMCVAYLFLDLFIGLIAAYVYQWGSNAVKELVSFVFYMVMFYAFRPFEKNEFLIHLNRTTVPLEHVQDEEFVV